jgi:hypothetical protein
MADNVAITAGSGTTIAADDVGAGVLVQRVKATWGPDGTANDTDVATGKPLPTQLRSPTGVDLTGSAGTASAAVLTVQGIASGVAQPVSLATAPALVASSAIIGNVRVDQTTDGTTNKVAADLRLAGTAAATGAGATGATVLRTTLATDSPGIIAVGTAGTPSANVVTMQGAASMTPLTAQLSETGNLVSGTITTAMTGTTSTSLVAAPGASLRNYITTFIVSNSHATVGTDVIIQDGSGGTTLMTIPAAAVYGGAVITLPAPLRQPTANTALYCANVTTGASTKVSAVGFKAA